MSNLKKIQTHAIKRSTVTNQAMVSTLIHLDVSIFTMQKGEKVKVISINGQDCLCGNHIGH